MIVWHPDVADWVAAQIPGCERGFGACKALGVVRRGELIGGIVFNNWSPEHGTIEISARGLPGWITRPVINEAFDYAFSFCQMVVATNSEKNTPARTVWERLGATRIDVPRLWGRDCAGVVYTFTDDQWNASKFRNRHVEAKSSSAA